MSRHKFAKLELAYGLAKGGQTELQVGHIQLTCDRIVSTCVGWPNGEKLGSACVRIGARPKSLSMQVDVTKQVDGQKKRKLKTYVDLRVRLARA